MSSASPTRDDVDPFTPTKPLFMPRADGVSALVNSRALELAGITKNTPDPEGSRFERDAEGEPTGYVWPGHGPLPPSF